MLNVKGPEGDLGVIIARFQTPVLTPAHCELIETVRARHQKFLIILGTSPVTPSTKNPMDFATRWSMIQETYPGALILALSDNRSDDLWSQKVDTEIRSFFPHEKVVLYGARDSFIKHYTGKFNTVELEAFGDFASTKARQEAFHHIKSTEDFRRGVCYAAANQYRKNVLCVDVAVINHDKQQLLLGRKKEDGGLWRFFGGHVNVGETGEAAARREVQEECGASIDGLSYLGTANIDDWRYDGIKDGTFSIFYAGYYQFGKIEGADDIDGSVQWFDFDKVTEEMFVPEHHVLCQMFFDGICPD